MVMDSRARTDNTNRNREDTMVALTNQARAKTAKANNHLAVMMIKTHKDNNKDTETE